MSKVKVRAYFKLNVEEVCKAIKVLKEYIRDKEEWNELYMWLVDLEAHLKCWEHISEEN